MSLPPNYRQAAMMAAPAPSTPGAPSTPQRPPARPLPPSTPSTPSAKPPPDAPSPFTTPQHGNPAFAPQKLGGSGTPGSKGSAAGGDGRGLPKAPKGPDKPLMPYMRYSRKVWDQVKANNQELKLWEIGKIIGGMWRDLPETDKQNFVDEYEAEKLEYEKAVKVYHSSPAYLAYIAAKNKAAAGGSSTAKEDPDTSSATLATPKLDRRIDIQPAEDDDDYDDSITHKQLCHSRYVRNHRLINEVFSDTMVPDVRSVVTAQRLSVLRRQVQSLTMHQKKLETELTQIEEKFDQKKKRFLEAGDVFQRELKKIKTNHPRIDEAYMQGLVEREKENLKRAEEARRGGGEAKEGAEGQGEAAPAANQDAGSAPPAPTATSVASSPPPRGNVALNAIGAVESPIVEGQSEEQKQ